MDLKNNSDCIKSIVKGSDTEPYGAKNTASATANEPALIVTKEHALGTSESNGCDPAGGRQKNDDDCDECVSKFEELDIKPEILRGIFAYGYEKPSAIQQRAIMPVARGRDVVAQAQSGTGKTATFSIGLLERIDIEERAIQAIILSPTRELAQQSVAVVKEIGRFLGVGVHGCIGGTDRPTVRDVKILRQEDIKVVVGTPGRIMDLFRRRALNPNDIKILVIDEADEMLGHGFKEQIQSILTGLPASMQVCTFSATMTLESLDITSRFMNNPVRILVKQEELTLDGIKQFFIAIPEPQFKLETLFDLYAVLSISQSIVYCNSRRKVEFLYEEMTAQDYTVSRIHGDLSQEERNEVMRDFRAGSTRVLITTDLLARGIDVQSVSLVINYELPNNRENYIHRIGRSGRWGRKGVAINFITPSSVHLIQDIEAFYGTVINPMPKNVADLIAVY